MVGNLVELRVKGMEMLKDLCLASLKGLLMGQQTACCSLWTLGHWTQQGQPMAGQWAMQMEHWKPLEPQKALHWEKHKAHWTPQETLKATLMVTQMDHCWEWWEHLTPLVQQMGGHWAMQMVQPTPQDQQRDVRWGLPKAQQTPQETPTAMLKGRCLAALMGLLMGLLMCLLMGQQRADWSLVEKCSVRGLELLKVLLTEKLWEMHWGHHSA